MMTTPNSYTRQALTSIAGNTANSAGEISRVLPHMRSVAHSLPGHHGAAARQAVRRAEELESLLAEADKAAESAKTLFRCATDNRYTSVTPSAQEPLTGPEPALDGKSTLAHPA